jgi:uncharacterized membrane protein (DUF2068 family)
MEPSGWSLIPGPIGVKEYGCGLMISGRGIACSDMTAHPTRRKPVHEVWTEHEAKPRRKWHRETFTCAFSGHVVPAAQVAKLRPEDAGLGIDLPDGRRLARCLRCDAWIQTTAPAKPTREHLPSIDELQVPKRGRALRDHIVIRLIAIDRAIHSVLFGIIATGLSLLEAKFGSVNRWAQDLVNTLTRTTSDTGPATSRTFIVRELERLLHLRSHTVLLLAITAAAYCVIEGVEAVGLWGERRWAEYLTAIATAGFLPFEIHELVKRVTVLRVTALVVNLAILAWLVWKKRLFGIRGGAKALEVEEEFDRHELFGPPQGDRATVSTPGAGAP